MQQTYLQLWSQAPRKHQISNSHKFVFHTSLRPKIGAPTSSSWTPRPWTTDRRKPYKACASCPHRCSSNSHWGLYIFVQVHPGLYIYVTIKVQHHNKHLYPQTYPHKHIHKKRIPWSFVLRCQYKMQQSVIISHGTGVGQHTESNSFSKQFT